MHRYSQSELMRSVLEPLLDDFTYWFERARTLLEAQELPSMTTEQQADLLARVHQASQEVAAAIALFKATGRQAGIDPASVTRWHYLVAEYWRASIEYRSSQNDGQ